MKDNEKTFLGIHLNQIIPMFALLCSFAVGYAKLVAADAQMSTKVQEIEQEKENTNRQIEILRLENREDHKELRADQKDVKTEIKELTRVLLEHDKKDKK